jgi:hypothetical protein
MKLFIIRRHLKHYVRIGLACASTHEKGSGFRLTNHAAVADVRKFFFTQNLFVRIDFKDDHTSAAIQS